MPHSQYVPGSSPPTTWDRVLFNPYGTALGLMAIILGPVVLISTFTGLEVSNALAQTHTGMRLLISGGLALGGALTLFGIFHPRKRVSELQAMIIELLGTIPLATGAFAYGVGVIGSGNNLAIVTIIVTLGVGSAYLLRGWGLYKSEGRVRAHLEAAERIGR